jgi:nicotinamidase-related amidase
MSELTLDPRTTAIVVIDLQKGITQYPTTPFTAQTVIANAAQILAAARRAGAQPILVHVPVSSDGRDRLQAIADQPMRTTQTPPPD